jgi:precorrin-6B methylase 2
MIKEILDYLYFIYEYLFSHILFFSTLYLIFHKNAVEKEIFYFHLSQSDRILHIGCGAIPYTLILISRELKAYVLGIDHKKKIVNIANKFLKKNNLVNKCRIVVGEGNQYSVSDFNVIIISYGVENQDLVLKHVFNSMQDNARIILRKSTTDKNEYLNSIVNNFSIQKIRLLLTQESCLIVKKDAI